MKKQTYIVSSLVVIALILGALSWWAMDRGIIYFTGSRPHFSAAAISAPRPSLDRPVSFPADFPDDAKTIFNQDLAKTKAALRANPQDVASWYDLATLYRTVNDYQGAAEIWRYLVVQDPRNGVALHNLGEYYFHTAKDYPTAETYYMKSIVVTPQLEQDYLDLFDMYRYVYKQDTNAAADILKQGIQSVGMPQAIDFMVALAQYYEGKGDTADALTYYKEALSNARQYTNTALAATLSQDVRRLAK